MRTTSKIFTLSIALVLGLVVPVALGQPRVVNTFNSESEVGQWARWWGDDGCAPMLPELSFDATMDAGGTSSAGSMKIVSHFDAAAGCNSNAICHWFGFGDMSGYLSLDFDVYVDSTSAVTGWGSHGWLQWGYRSSITTNATFADPAVQLNGGGDDGKWLHVSIPMTQFEGFPASATQMDWMCVQPVGWGNLTGDVTIWLDNIQFIAPSMPPPPPPATAAMVLNRFDDPAEVANDWLPADWTEAVISKFEFDPAEDAGGGGPGSGSLYIEADFSNLFDCNNCADPNNGSPTCITEETPPHTVCNMIVADRDLHAASGSFDFRSYGRLEFDYKVTSDSPLAGTTHGGLELFPLTGGSWLDIQNQRPAGWGLGGGTNDDKWVHVSYPAMGAGAPCSDRLFDVRAFRLQVWGGDYNWDQLPNILNGKVKMWIDNVVWTPPPPAAKGFFVVSDFDGAAEVDPWTTTMQGNTEPGHETLIPQLVEKVFDPAEDLHEDPNSGSMRVVVDFLDSDGSGQFQLGRGIFGELGVDMRDYNWFKAAIKVKSDSTTTSWGNHGWSNWWIHNPYNWNDHLGVDIPRFQDGACFLDQNGWFHVDWYFGGSDYPARNMFGGITIQVGGMQPGRYTIWVDEVRLGRIESCTNPERCELCNNLDAETNPIDDNGDGLGNCADPDCYGTFSCPIERPAQCGNGLDDDGDGAYDCADPDCLAVAVCKGQYQPFADVDGDGDVDQDDFGSLQSCFTGAETALAPDTGCEFLDRDRDHDVDMADLQKFVSCVSGPAVPADVSCGD